MTHAKPWRFGFIALSMTIALTCGSQRTGTQDHWQTDNGIFKIRVTEYQRKTLLLSKFDYVFETTMAGSDDWHKIMVISTDDDIPIPREQVKILDQQTAFVFMATKFAVTADAGRTWSLWDATESTANLKYPNQTFIKNVDITPDGIGTMILASCSDLTEAARFRTTDYGRHWTGW
jgi:hypothetical protein